MEYSWIVLISGIVGLAFALFLVRYVLKQDPGSKAIQEISSAIKEGANAFLNREYRILSIFVIVVAIILLVIPSLGWKVAISFVFGSICSMGAGLAGMNMAIRSNGRTASAAQKSLNAALRISFRGGAVMGMTVVSIGVIGISILFFAFHNDANFLMIIPAYGFGASGVALFARVGGGIYTKAADTGADIVGKVEKGIPEDDPRNAACIADFVGDNVGDVAGMGADLFESYVESIIATMTLSAVAIAAGLASDNKIAWYLPMMIAVGGIVASIIGAFLVRVGEKAEMRALLAALRRGTLGASILTAIFSFLVIYFIGGNIGVFWAVLAGLVAGVLIGESTNYFTSYIYSPTKRIAAASTRGGGSTMISGFAVGLMSTLPPVILVAIAVIIAYRFADIYGVAISGIGMLSTLGITLATDAYGPIADNAGGIAEMAHLPHEVREKTDALDSLGNTTAATGKGFAIGSAALTALALLLSFTQAAGIEASKVNLLDPYILAGLFIGVMLPAVFCSMTMNAVGIAGGYIVEEVRRQFREIKGLWEGTARPEYSKCVDICTRGALKQMLAPSLMAVIAPILVAVILGKYALVGFLVGSTASGFVLAVTLANAGGAWDNAKKYIEAGNFGGKGSDAHKAAVIGDTTGDPMKDTSGPSLNIMIKLMAVISLVLAPVIINMTGLI